MPGKPSAKPLGSRRKPLTDRQQAFVYHYLAGEDGVRGIGAKSAIAAGYSPRGANVQAAKLLQMPAVEQQIERYQQRACSAVSVTVQRLVEEYAAIAFSRVCILDYLRDDAPPVNHEADGQYLLAAELVRPRDQWTDEMLRMCEELDFDPRTGRLRLKLRNRDEALARLTRYTGGFVDRSENETGPRTLARQAANARLAARALESVSDEQIARMLAAAGLDPDVLGTPDEDA